MLLSSKDKVTNTKKRYHRAMVLKIILKFFPTESWRARKTFFQKINIMFIW